MGLIIRRGKTDDAAKSAEIFYEAFTTIAEQHNFPPDISPPDSGTELAWAKRFSNPALYGIVAELDGHIVGSNFLDERDSVAGVGPLTVAPTVQDKKIGQGLMKDVLNRSAEKKHPGVRLVTGAYNRRSLVLYTKMGFEVREMLVSMHGPQLQLQIPNHKVRPATKSDLPICNQLCWDIHGHERGGVLLDAIEKGTATVVESGNRITGYATEISSSGYAVSENNNGLKALIAAAPELVESNGFLLPTRNGELFRWCLQNGLKVVQPATLMSLGLYNEPLGSFLPSIFY